MNTDDQIGQLRAAYLEELIREKGRNPREVAIRVSGNPTLIYDIIKRKTKNPKISTWEGIARELDVPVEQLLEARTPKSQIIPEVARLLRQLDPKAQARIVPHIRGLLQEQDKDPLDE